MNAVLKVTGLPGLTALSGAATPVIGNVKASARPAWGIPRTDVTCLFLSLKHLSIDTIRAEKYPFVLPYSHSISCFTRFQCSDTPLIPFSKAYDYKAR